VRAILPQGAAPYDLGSSCKVPVRIRSTLFDLTSKSCISSREGGLQTTNQLSRYPGVKPPPNPHLSLARSSCLLRDHCMVTGMPLRQLHDATEPLAPLVLSTRGYFTTLLQEPLYGFATASCCHRASGPLTLLLSTCPPSPTFRTFRAAGLGSSHP